VSELQTIGIDSLADPRVADYANLRDRQLRQLDRCDIDEGGIFIAEGELVVRQLLNSGLPIRSLLLTPQRLQAIGPALAAGLGGLHGVPIYIAQQQVMNQIVGFNIHRGILAAGQRPRPVALTDMLRRVRTLVVLETLANHDNVGGIFRAAAALAGLAQDRPWHGSAAAADSEAPSGAGVLLSPQCCDPLYRKSIRVSVGAALLLPFARLEPWPAGLMELKRHGFTVIALTPSADAISLDELRPGAASRPALLLGAEGSGLTPGAMAAADLRVRIPIHAGVDSLNVVVAAGVALHALRGAQ
jgi:tRNA G18 (ribose-2'-O)-methylase SpoU